MGENNKKGRGGAREKEEEKMNGSLGMANK